MPTQEELLQNHKPIPNTDTRVEAIKRLANNFEQTMRKNNNNIVELNNLGKVTDKEKAVAVLRLTNIYKAKNPNIKIVARDSKGNVQQAIEVGLGKNRVDDIINIINDPELVVSVEDLFPTFVNNIIHQPTKTQEYPDLNELEKRLNNKHFKERILPNWYRNHYDARTPPTAIPRSNGSTSYGYTLATNTQTGEKLVFFVENGQSGLSYKTLPLETTKDSLSRKENINLETTTNSPNRKGAELNWKLNVRTKDAFIMPSVEGDRAFVVVEIEGSHGTKLTQTFYRSTGNNSGNKGTWFPCNGTWAEGMSKHIAKEDYINKLAPERLQSGQKNPAKRMGGISFIQENGALFYKISEQLSKLDIDPTEKVPYEQVNAKLRAISPDVALKYEPGDKTFLNHINQPLAKTS